jgi:TonB-dependent SusC/RagA subfamily outer membrane receptor
MKMKCKFHHPPLTLRTRVRKGLCVLFRPAALLLLTLLLCINTYAYAQYVSITKQNTSLENVFAEIKKQTGYTFFYKGKINPGELKLDIDLKRASLDDALNTCLRPFKLNYTIVDKTIVITSATAPAATAAQEPAPEQVITGMITDSTTREPMIAVTIMVKNKSGRALSSEKGTFQIEAEEGDIIVFTSIGYRRKEMVVRGTTMTVVLAPNTSSLSDVVVTGYQNIKKDNYTGNAIVVKGDQLKQINPQNIIKGLASFDPSFRLAQNNLVGSDPNAMPKINVRGSTALPSVNGEILDRNNLSSSYNLPVFIMDGFEVSLQKVVDLDINRIASVTILKDAAATAVYGSRAANGVIVISTKAPAPGKLRLTYNFEMKGTAPDLTDYSVLNAKDKLEYEKLAGLYDGANNAGVNQDQLDQLYYNKYHNVISGVNTYWLSQPLRNTLSQKHSIYAEGGDSTFSYCIDVR